MLSLRRLHKRFGAASKLALADPEEPDANTMFEAVRILDKIQNENEAQVVTLTEQEAPATPRTRR